MLNNCKLSYRVEGFFFQISSSFMRYSLQLDGSKRSRPSTGLHASKNLLTLVSSSLGISQGTSNLPVLGKVQGSNFFGFLNLLLVRLDLPWSWSIRACIRSWFFLSSSAAKVSSLILRSVLRRFLEESPNLLLSASSSDSSSLTLVSIFIMAFLPPLRAFTSASSARDWASLH